jgi:hypothetical protein|tara:strand:- start:1259 stop:1432 length:174 start_codon:yes stop_codon:yes gene_type:complete
MRIFLTVFFINSILTIIFSLILLNLIEQALEFLFGSIVLAIISPLEAISNILNTTTF